MSWKSRKIRLKQCFLKNIYNICDDMLVNKNNQRTETGILVSLNYLMFIVKIINT